MWHTPPHGCSWRWCTHAAYARRPALEEGTARIQTARWAPHATRPSLLSPWRRGRLSTSCLRRRIRHSRSAKGATCASSSDAFWTVLRTRHLLLVGLRGGCPRRPRLRRRCRVSASARRKRHERPPVPFIFRAPRRRRRSSAHSLVPAQAARSWTMARCHRGRSRPRVTSRPSAGCRRAHGTQCLVEFAALRAPRRSCVTLARPLLYAARHMLLA